MDMTEKEKQDRLYEEFPNVARETIDVALKENDFNFARIILAIEHEDNGDTTLGATGFYAGKVIK